MTRAARGSLGVLRRAGVTSMCAAAVLAGAGCSSGSSNGPAPSSSKASTHASVAPSSSARPDLLSVPQIDLITGLKPEGLRNGEVNPAAGEVIWFTGSQRVAPGAKGTAVIAGHVANGSKPDVFAKLDAVKKGGSFDLVMADGSTQRFSVKRADVVDKQALRHDQEVWGANTATTRVVIITCDDELGFGSDGHRKANYVVVGEPA